MSDIMDKMITLGLGFDKKAREVLDELERLGSEGREEKKAAKEGEGEEGEELSARKRLENRLAEDGMGVLKDILSGMTECRKKLEDEVTGSSDKLLEKLNVATKEDFEVVMEMARVAREKVDSLEKRIEEIEKK